MITTSIVFDHRQRANGGLGPVEIRVTVDRKSYYINTFVKCLARDFVGGRVTSSAKGDTDVMNDRINIIARRVEEIVNDCIDSGVPINAADIRRQITDAGIIDEVKATAFIDWVDEQIPKLQVCKGTNAHYLGFAKKLREFGKMNSWDGISVEHIYEFDSWLHTFHGHGGKLLSAAGVYTYHKCLKSIMNRALLFDKIIRNPYDILKGKFSRGEKENVEYLTEEEMQKFCDLKVQVGTQLEVAKDLFILQMYTGLSYSDAEAFDINDYKQEGDRWVCVGERIKTGVSYVSELLPPVIEVLRKYGWKSPQLDNSDYKIGRAHV